MLCLVLWIIRQYTRFVLLSNKYKIVVLTFSVCPFKCQVSDVAGALFCLNPHCITMFSLSDEDHVHLMVTVLYCSSVKRLIYFHFSLWTSRWICIHYKVVINHYQHNYLLRFYWTSYTATCLDHQVVGYLQAMKVHKIKITVAISFLYGWIASHYGCCNIRINIKCYNK